jgi:hypothetical protein
MLAKERHDFEKTSRKSCGFLEVFSRLAVAEARDFP